MTLKKILIGKSNRIEIHFLRQTLSSMFSFALEFFLLLLLTEKLGLYYLVSAVIGFLAGNLLLHQLSVRWIYDKRRFNNSRTELLLFLSLSGLSLLINTGLYFIMVEILGIHYLVAKPLGAGLIFFLNFIVKKLWLFSHKRKA